MGQVIHLVNFLMEHYQDIIVQEQTYWLIELICNVTGEPSWIVNGSGYSLSQLSNGALPGHNRTGTNILVNSPVNNTEYICQSATNDSDTLSDPAYITVTGM